MRISLWTLLFMLSGYAGFGQYTLDEIGLGLGGGLALQTNSEASLGGVGSNLNAYYSHWACGKGYGFHVTAGGFLNFNGAANAELTANSDSVNPAILSAGPSVGGMFKLRGHSYHRDKETAFFIGGNFRFPLGNTYNSDTESGPLKDFAEQVGGFVPGIHASVAFRRPFGDEGHFYIRPGVEYYLLPSFKSAQNGAYSNLYLFLNLEVTLWDQKG